ncbi:MAG: hypothetical protein ABJO09_16395 [Hyphomicrobiales bacterium]
MSRLLITLCLLYLPLGAFAQDRSGNDTASDWIAQHFVSFGLWDSVCDERVENDELKQRCYLRYVDVYSPRPNFLATFAFVFTEKGESVVEMGFEKRTRYNEKGFRIEKAGKTIWAFEDPCLNTSKCRLTGANAQNFLSQLSMGDSLVQDFKDRTRKDRVLNWDLTHFADALADYRAAATERSLLN